MKGLNSMKNYFAPFIVLILFHGSLFLNCASKEFRKSQTQDSVLEKDSAAREKLKRVSKILNDGNSFFQKGTYDKALEKANLAINTYPTAPGYYLAGISEYKMGKNEEALASLKKGTEVDPENEQILLTLGIIYTAEGKNEDAIEVYSKLENLPVKEKYNYSFKKAVLLKNQGKFEQAYSTLKSIPKNEFAFPAQLNMQLGDAAVQLKKYEEAEAYFEEARKNDPELISAKKSASVTRVALFYKETLCAFLPPWSGVDGFHGYSINAKIDALTAYPLGNSEFGTIPDRVQASRDYWETRSQKGAWKEIQEKRLHFLESKLGKHDKYWSADGGKYPQLGIVRFRSEKFPDLLIYSTIGMSAQNMPCVELFHKNYEDYARIELVLSVKIGSEGLERSESWVPHLIGELIRFPWNMAKWLGHGHTISMTRKDPEALYLDFASVLFRDLSSFSAATAPDLSGLISENGKQVRFLTLLPLSEEEKEYAQKDGIQSFNQSWDRKGLPWYHDAERQSLV
uniref:Suppressor of fused-like domain-containing protein n=1 Tax=Leptospira ellisii TaxID=2023197 RepID=A0A2N0B9Q6_9LEPT|nr:hypothetical protein CH379_08660 [Leptospira ellisii]